MRTGRRSAIRCFFFVGACAVSSIISTASLLPCDPLRFVCSFAIATTPVFGVRVSTPHARTNARIVSRIQSASAASPGALTNLIKQAQFPADLWAVSDDPWCDLVHRATILFGLAEMAKISEAADFAAGIAGAAPFRELLRNIMEDLRAWKSSGSLKDSVRDNNDIWIERARYLGSVIWALGELKPAISQTLPAAEEKILFEMAMLAALEALPESIRNGCAQGVFEMMFGLRFVGRTLQSDAFYSTIAPALMQFIDKHSREPQRDIATSLMAFASHGLQEPAITEFFVKAKAKVISASWTSYLKDLVAVVKGYALYANRCEHPTEDPTNFTVSLVRRDGQQLGITLNSVRGEPGLRISKVTKGSVLRWNRLHPEWKVVEGDRILNANGVDGSAQKLASEITKKKSITMILQRGKVTVQVHGRRVLDGRVPDGVRDEAMMLSLGKHLAAMFAQETDVPATIKYSSSAIICYIVLGIRSEPLFSFVAEHVLKYGRRYVSSYTCELLWAFGKMDIGRPDVVDVLVKRAFALLKSDQVPVCDLPVLYHALRNFGYTDGRSERVLLENVVRGYHLNFDKIKHEDGTPKQWV